MIVLNLGNQAALHEALMKPYECTVCDVQWRAAGTIPCWLCGELDHVRQKWPKLFADACQVDPVAPQ